MASPELLSSADDQRIRCLWCAQEREFEMPAALQNACERGDLVVFAGAGISTEQRVVLSHTLYTQLVGELELDPSAESSFPEVMTRYEAEHGRPMMIQRIKKHLDYVRSFPNLDREAGRFHRELASLYTVTEIFTTNWDTYFERECGAQPFVTEEDWALWKAGERSVFKLHGSISNPGSIIATEADYEECHKALDAGLNGARLKQMLATKTIVFIGYSLRDSDFVAIYEVLKEKMGKLMPRAYVVTLDDRDPPEVARDMHVIRTSGTHFVHALKEAFDEKELLRDERFEIIPFVRSIVRHAHQEMLAEGEMCDDPAMYMCACYQDGLMDAFDHQTANARSGKYFHRCYTGAMIDLYEKLLDERLEEGRFATAAYLEGYLKGLAFLISDDEDRKELPIYFVAGYDGEPLKKLDQYREAAPRFAEWEPEVFAYAERQAGRLAPGTNFHHQPSL